MPLYFKCVRCKDYYDTQAIDKYRNEHKGSYDLCTTNRYEDVALCPKCLTEFDIFIKDEYLSNSPVDYDNFNHRMHWRHLCKTMDDLKRHVLGVGYYNMGADVYTCTTNTANDISKAYDDAVKSRKKWQDWCIAFVVAYFVQMLINVLGGILS